MADPVEDDLLLTAFLDGELPPDEHGALTARLLSEPQLRARLEELRGGGAVLRAGLDAALGEAPKANMAAKLARTPKSRNRPGYWGRWARAAAIAAIAFVAGFVASRVLSPASSPEEESWRDSVAEYMSLYTSASFAPRDPEMLRSELDALSRSVGVDLSESNLRHGPIAPRSGILLQFHGAPLAQIGYVIDGQPAAFCIIRDGEPDAAPTRARVGDFSVVSWAKSGRGFMVLSAAPADRIADLARSLQDRATVN